MDVADRVVLIVEGSETYRGLSRAFGEKGVLTAHLNPEEDINKDTSGLDLRGIVYEPYYFMFEEGRRFRPILDKLLRRVKSQGAQRIVLSTLDIKTLEEEDFRKGTGFQYDLYFRKPVEHFFVANSFLSAELNAFLRVEQAWCDGYRV